MCNQLQMVGKDGSGYARERERERPGKRDGSVLKRRRAVSVTSACCTIYAQRRSGKCRQIYGNASSILVLLVHVQRIVIKWILFCNS